MTRRFTLRRFRQRPRRHAPLGRATVPCVLAPRPRFGPPISSIEGVRPVWRFRKCRNGYAASRCARRTLACQPRHRRGIGAGTSQRGFCVRPVPPRLVVRPGSDCCGVAEGSLTCWQVNLRPWRRRLLAEGAIYEHATVARAHRDALAHDGPGGAVHEFDGVGPVAHDVGVAAAGLLRRPPRREPTIVDRRFDVES